MRLLLTPLFCVLVTLPAAHAQKKDVKNLLQEAKLAQQAGDLVSAIATYRSAIALEPRLAEPHADLGAALAEQGDLHGAAAEFHVGIEQSTERERPAIMLALGLVYFKMGDLPSAQTQFKLVLAQPAKRIQPEQVKAATMLATCDLKLNDPAAALAVLAPRAAYVDQDPDLARQYAIALIRTGNLHDGALMMHRVAETTNDGASYQIAGSTALDLGEYEQARRDLETGYHIDPRLIGMSTTLGIVRLQLGDSVAAEAALRAALRTNPDDFLANLYLGVLLLSRHDAKLAKSFLDRSEGLQPVTPPALSEVVITPSISGELDPAIDLLERTTGDDAAVAERHRQLASLFRRTGRGAEADAEEKLVAKM